MSAKQEKGMTPETIKIGRRTYRKFIRPPGPVNDGTFRCFACGQIDEPPYHEDEFCPAMTSATNTGGGQEEQS